MGGSDDPDGAHAFDVTGAASLLGDEAVAEDAGAVLSDRPQATSAAPSRPNPSQRNGAEQ